MSRNHAVFVRALPLLLQAGCALCFALAAAGCVTRPPAPAPLPAPPAPAAPPTVTRGQFTVEANTLDTWNAVGQILVRTPGVTYEGRAQMLGLYSVAYRGERLLLLTRAVPLSETIRSTTTTVTAGSHSGAPVDSDAAAELLAILQRELPAEIVSVRARQAAEKAEKEAKAHKAKKTKHHRRK